MRAETETTWLRLVAGGDLAAFESLYRAYQAPLFRYFMNLLNSREAADELVNDVLLDVWRNAATFKGRSQPSTWLFSIAHHKAVDELRRRRPAPILLDTLRDVAGERSDSRLGEAFEMLPEDVALAISSLSAEHREVIQLTFLQGCSYEKVAEIAGCPIGTVKTRMFHAKKHLRRIVAERGRGRKAI